jgi:hypothetical protein
MDFVETNIINVTGYPMSSSKAFSSLKPYHFTLKNKCEANTDYQIILNVLNSSNSEILPYINLSLDGVNTTKLSSLVSTSLPTGVSSSNALYSYVIDTGSLLGINSSQEFNLYLWIDESANNDIMGKKFEAQVTIYSVAR